MTRSHGWTVTRLAWCLPALSAGLAWWAGRTGERYRAGIVSRDAPPDPGSTRKPDFIREMINRDTEHGPYGGRVQTRFPPEPNGFLHIGHAKSISLNFGLADEFGGICRLRFDDTNPETEDLSFTQAITDDVRWLGWNPGEPAYASDYFEQLHAWAVRLIEAGLAYVDDQDAETISAMRGGFTTPGTDSPWRDRPVSENLDLFARMTAGEFADGARVLRARIDMAHPNMSMRDPVMYRIRKQRHFRTGDRWCVYPTYDWAHGQSDAVEGTTHSLCTLEFEANRQLYGWYHEKLGLGSDRPRQTEFARLNLTHTVLSKRRLAQLVEEGHTDGWDDARMPTLAGLRRRGYPPEAIRAFCAHIGVARVNGVHEIELLESFVRTHHNLHAQRRMVVVDPLEVVIVNWPDSDPADGGGTDPGDRANAGNVTTERSTATDTGQGAGREAAAGGYSAPVGTGKVGGDTNAEAGADTAHTVFRQAVNNPEDESAGVRDVPFSGRLWIERDDFMADPPAKFYRLAPGREVRLRAAWFMRCVDVETDADGNPTRLLCSYDPETAGGKAPDGRKVKATIHWVSADHALDVDVALYERLFAEAHPGADGSDPLASLNPDSRVIRRAKAEPAVADIAPGEVVQFERLGYFARDLDDDPTTPPAMFHRTVGLRDEWANLQRRRPQP